MKEKEDDGSADSTENPGSDLRYSSHDDGHTRIERSLDGSGRLARGDHTHMHTVRFTARAVPRAREKQAPEVPQATAPPTQNDEPLGPSAPADESHLRSEQDAAPAPGASQRLLDWMFRRPQR